MVATPKLAADTDGLTVEDPPHCALRAGMLETTHHTVFYENQGACSCPGPEAASLEDSGHPNYLKLPLAAPNGKETDYDQCNLFLSHNVLGIPFGKLWVDNDAKKI